MMIVSRSDGYSRYSHTNSKRSRFHSLTRVEDLRRRTTSCWRSRRFSASSRARRVNRDRIASSSWSETRPSTASLPYAHPTVIPDKVFGRHNLYPPATLRSACLLAIWGAVAEVADEWADYEPGPHAAAARASRQASQVRSCSQTRGCHESLASWVSCG